LYEQFLEIPLNNRGKSTGLGFSHMILCMMAEFILEPPTDENSSASFVTGRNVPATLTKPG
jgi:hypothetical protein